MKKLVYLFLISLTSGALFLSSVTITKAVSAPVPTSPCGNQTVDSLRPQLAWTGDYTGYFWQIDFYDGLEWQSLIPLGETKNSTKATIPTNLTMDTKYRWRVQNRYLGDWSKWCEFNTNSVAQVPIVAGEPTILTLNPKQGLPGTPIDIPGANFSCGMLPKPNMVIFTAAGQAPVEETATCVSSSLLKTKIPSSFPASVKSIDVQVRTEGKTSNSVPFTITQASQQATAPVPPPVAAGQSKATCEGQPLNLKDPSLYQAQKSDGKLFAVAYDGIVPCGRCVLTNEGTTKALEEKIKGADGKFSGNGTYVPCQFCHFQVMFMGIVNFILWKIVFPIGILLVVIGGAMYIFSQGDPGKITQAKSIITSVAVGLAIILGAWLAVNIFFNFIGLSKFGDSLLGPSKWFAPQCDITLPGAK